MSRDIRGLEQNEYGQEVKFWEDLFNDQDDVEGGQALSQGMATGGRGLETRER